MGYHDNPPYFLSAYDLAVKWGFRGTEQDWLDSLTAYAIAKQAGYTGTVADWAAMLIDPVPHIQIGEVVTLAGGSMATASFSGDKRNPVLNLGIPRGVGEADALPYVGGTMLGDINMDGKRIIGLPEPVEDGEAVPKEYADKMLPKSGGTMAGALNVQTPTENSHAVNKEYADKMMPKSGGTMTGALNVLTPTENNHAVPKKYADDLHETAKKYADDKHLLLTVAVTADGWTGDAAPYTQTIAVADILETDRPHWSVVYSEDAGTYLEEKDAFSLVDDLDTAEGSVTFTCFEDKPETDITIQLEVNR